ncbi:cupin domain-containing protein [Pseudorhodoferax sp.]|uniref:cupin domain-containing protein n=1 Tax=Pseudorhodoferax sp. TaxID=1993553 RepID=UPI002DD640A7|nr:cupin domain-containing protein [Pseudorhodoferax sp.]
MNELRRAFPATAARLVDTSGSAPRSANEQWAPLIISRATIEAEVERLAELPRPANGRREALIVHPSARPDTPGLAPGIQVRLSVLLPGESTAPFRHNATEVNFCIQGSGHTRIGGRRIAFARYDVWNHPSWLPYTHYNDGDALQVRLTYSNTPVLQHMDIYIAEEGANALAAVPAAGHAPHADDARRRNPFGVFPISDDGGLLMPYEVLINPERVRSVPMLFPWRRVKPELDKLEALGQDYIGRRLYMLYNPATGRTNGITPSFFATMTIRPPRIVDRPHRHVSAAINYYFHGSGHSVVAGNRYEWQAGDLMLSAPGWAVHNHASYEDQVYELTVQDQPLNIYMESLLWQEDLKGPVSVLGSEQGFSTNRAAG